MKTDRTQAEEATHKFLILFRYLRQYARQINSQGIKPRQFAVLRYLSEIETATVGQIQAHLYCSPSTASTVIASLEEKGYLIRTRSAKDNRVVLVILTEAGQQVVENTPLGGIPLLRRQLGRLPQERLILIDSALNELMVLLDVKDQE